MGFLQELCLKKYPDETIMLKEVSAHHRCPKVGKVISRRVFNEKGTLGELERNPQIKVSKSTFSRVVNR